MDFPTFVAGLIEGVFNAIVRASIQQVDAYGELVKSVAKSLDDYIDGVTEAGAECLVGLCATRTGANAGTTSSGHWTSDSPERAHLPAGGGGRAKAPVSLR